MKTTLMIGTLILACGSMLAQSSQTQQPSGQSMGMSSNMQMGSQKSQGMQGMQGMKDHMQQMQAEMQQMKSRVAKMRSDAEKVQDPNAKTALLDNADMWDQFMKHMQSHMDMMMKGDMHHGGMMKHKKTPSSQPSQSTPPNPQ